MADRFGNLMTNLSRPELETFLNGSPALISMAGGAVTGISGHLWPKRARRASGPVQLPGPLGDGREPGQLFGALGPEARQ